MTIHTIPTTRASAAPAPSLEVLAARLVRAGREAAAAAHDCAAGSAVGQWRQVRDWLAPLAERRPLDDLDDDALVAALGVVGRDLEAEGAGTERRVVDHNWDDDGTRYDIWAEVPAHTERGERLLEVQRLLREVQALHAEVLDWVAAARALRDLAGGEGRPRA